MSRGNKGERRERPRITSLSDRLRVRICTDHEIGMGKRERERERERGETRGADT